MMPSNTCGLGQGWRLHGALMTVCPARASPAHPRTSGGGIEPKLEFVPACHTGPETARGVPDTRVAVKRVMEVITSTGCEGNRR